MTTLPIWSGGLQNTIEHPGIALNQELQLMIPSQHIIAIDDKPVCPHNPFATIAAVQSQQIITNGSQQIRNVTVKLLSPPIIVSLRKEQTFDGNDYNSRINKNKGNIMSAAELNYFKNRNNNVTLFIHGYNVAYGQFGPKADKVILDPSTLSLGLPAIFISGQGDSTIYRDLSMLRQYFPQIPPNTTSINGRADLEVMLNGTDAHNWIIHMEDNLNRATTQFNRTNYLKFERLLNIAWSGDPFPLDYVAAIQAISDPKIEPATHLAQIIMELKAAGINNINVIAHSLGNGLLVKAMDILGKNNPNIISHAFLWQPAIPDNTFARTEKEHDPAYFMDPALDPWYVPDAYKAAQQMTILYSFNDNILGPIMPHQAIQEQIDQEKDTKELWMGRIFTYFGISLYILSVWIGVPPEYLLLSGVRQRYYLTWIALYPCSKDGHYFNKQFSNEVEYWSIKESIGFNIILEQLSQEQYTQFDLMIPCIKELFALMKVLENSSYRPSAAMGYSGPDLESPLMQNLLESGKLILINQSEWLWEHSGMRIPAERVMQNVYQKHIIGGDGVKQFGLYTL